MAIQDVTVVSVPVSDEERARGSPSRRWVRAHRGLDWFESMPAWSLNGPVVMSTSNRITRSSSPRGVEVGGPPRPQSYTALETVPRDLEGSALVLQHMSRAVVLMGGRW
jgi:hypothetical protein